MRLKPPGQKILDSVIGIFHTFGQDSKQPFIKQKTDLRMLIQIGAQLVADNLQNAAVGNSRNGCGPPVNFMQTNFSENIAFLKIAESCLKLLFLFQPDMTWYTQSAFFNNIERVTYIPFSDDDFVLFERMAKPWGTFLEGRIGKNLIESLIHLYAYSIADRFTRINDSWISSKKTGEHDGNP